VVNQKEGERYAVQTVIGCNQCRMCRQMRQNLCEKGFTAIGYQYNGGFAEYIAIPKVAVDQGNLIPIADSTTHLQGSMIEPLSCCVNGMRYIPMEECRDVVIFGGGIIGVMNGLVARARGAKEITIMDISQERLDLHQKLGLPFDNWVNSGTTDPVEWTKEKTGGSGVDAVVVAASVSNLVPPAFDMLGHAGHLSLFAGLPKSDPVRPVDLNLIHYREMHVHGANSSVQRDYLDYREMHVHGANSSVQRDYLEARDLIESGKIDVAPLITHTYGIDDFLQAVATQGDPASGAMKVVMVYKD
jgi:L-iditol 2-dehydrogenase